MTFTENYLSELPSDLVEKILVMAGALPVTDSNDRHLYWKCDECRTSYTKCGQPRANSKPKVHYIRYSPDNLIQLTPDIQILKKKFYFHKYVMHWHYITYEKNVFLYLRKKN